MEKQTENKLAVRGTLPKPVTVNKPLVISATAILLFVVLIIIVMALTESSTKTAKVTEISVSQEPLTDEETSAALKALPQSYSEVDAIKKYYSDASQQNDTIQELKRQLDSIKSQDDSLREQVTQLLQHPDQIKHPVDPQTQQAKTSTMFFTGVGPPTEGISIKPMDGGAGGSAGGGGGPMGGGNAELPGIGNSNLVMNADDWRVQKLPPSEQTKFYSKQILNTHKMAVLKAADNVEDIYDMHNVALPVSPYEIQAGTVIPAVLITGVNTTLEGTSVAQVRNDMYDTVTGKYLLIPKGSRIIGDYSARVAQGQRRVLIAFNRIIRPDGSSILLGKPFGADMQGQTGMEGKVDEHWGRVLGAATLSTILSVGAGVASDNTGNNNNYYPAAKQNAILGGANGISQVGQSITNRALDVQPTLTLPAGFQFNVIVKKDMVLTPYAPSFDS